MREPSPELLKSWSADQPKAAVRVPQTLDEVYNSPAFPFRYDWAEALNKRPS